MRLKDLDFVDLYLGGSYADLKALPGGGATRAPVPAELEPEIAEIRKLCARLHQEQADPHFAMPYDDVLYRVTVMYDLRAEPIYFIRRMAADIRPIQRIGFPDTLRTQLMAPNLRGLVLIAGDQAVGKTTTAASLLVARLAAHGGLALAVEDPPETQMEGLHGEGRCIQVPASRRHGHYREQLHRAMRTGVGSLLIGEIRCEDTATEAIRNSVNGLLVLSTIHAKTPQEALMRLLAFASNSLPNAAEILASGLTAVLHQAIERVPGGGVRLIFKSLQFDGEGSEGIRAKVRDGRITDLQQDIDAQRQRTTWQ